MKLGFSRDGFHWHRPDRRVDGAMVCHAFAKGLLLSLNRSEPTSQQGDGRQRTADRIPY